jgi:hypothetical protein
MSGLLQLAAWLLLAAAIDPASAPSPPTEDTVGAPSNVASAPTVPLLEAGLTEAVPLATDLTPVLTPLGAVSGTGVSVGGAGYASQASTGVAIGLADLAFRAIVAIDGFELARGNELARGAFAFGPTEPVRVTTSGIEATSPIPSVLFDLREKRGTNEWRAAAGGAWTGNGLSASRNGEDEASPAQRGSGESLTANALDQSRTGDLSVGGPLVSRSLWFWGLFGGDHEAWTAFGGDRTETTLLREAGKLNAALSDSNSLALAWNRGHQDDSGLGAGPDRAPATLLDRNADANVWRLDDTQVVSASVYWSGRLGLADSRFTDHPTADAPVIDVDSAGVSQGTWFSDADHRQLASAQAQGAWLLRANNDLKLGGEARREHETADLTPAGEGLVLTSGQLYELPGGATAVQAWRAGQVVSRLDRFALWTQDDWTAGRATVTAGLRFDHQTLAPGASSVGGNPSTGLLPAVSFSGSGDGASRIDWSSLSPRFGVAWTPNHQKQFLVRASLARYGDPLDPALAERLTPTAPASAWATLYGGNTPPAIPADVHWVPSNFDPQLPGINPNAIDPRLHPEWNDEATASLQFAPQGGPIWTLTGVYRRLTGVLEDRLLIRDASGAVRTATASDWVQTGSLEGISPYYDLRSGLTPTGGTLLVNGDREQRFAAITLAGNRPLRGGWSLQGHLTLQDWTWSVGPDFVGNMDPTLVLGGGQRDGELVADPGTGVGALPLYAVARWSGDLSGTVELPWQTTVALGVEGREGFPIAYYADIARFNAGPVTVLADPDLNRFRYDRLVVFNARLERETTVSQDLGLIIYLDGFNLFNRANVIQREGNLGTTRAGFIDEMIAPRVLRLGLRLAFR